MGDVVVGILTRKKKNRGGEVQHTNTCNYFINKIKSTRDLRKKKRSIAAVEQGGDRRTLFIIYKRGIVVF